MTKENVKWKSVVTETKRKVLIVKDKECQYRFEKETDDTKELSNIVDKDEPVEKLDKRFMKRLDGFVHKYF